MLLFNITTSAIVRGTPVGITRVERELALRAQRHVEDEVAYGMFDRSSGNFHRLPNDVANEVLRGRLIVEFGSQRWSAKRVARALLLCNSKIFRFVQSRRGMNYSEHHVRAFRREIWEQLRGRRENGVACLSDVSLGTISLSQDTTVISAGADWEWLDLLSLIEQKQKARFRYYPVIHDLIAIYRPQFFHAHLRNLLQGYFGEVSWLADGFLCNSERTKSDLCRYFQLAGRPDPEAVVFDPGCDLPLEHHESSNAVLPSRLRGKSFVLCVSTIEPRKGHRMLYEAWDLAMQRGLLDPTKHLLVFVGRMGWSTGDLFDQVYANPLTQDTVVVLSGLSDAELGSIYAHAAFTAYPSQIEGYGLPVVEALSHGKFCIVSTNVPVKNDCASLVEQVEPSDILGWASAISSYLNNHEKVAERERQVSSSFVPTTWDVAAEDFFSKLKTLDQTCRAYSA